MYVSKNKYHHDEPPISFPDSGGAVTHPPDFGEHRIGERALARNVRALCVSMCCACAQARVLYVHIGVVWCARALRASVSLCCLCVCHRT